MRQADRQAGRQAGSTRAMRELPRRTRGVRHFRATTGLEAGTRISVHASRRVFGLCVCVCVCVGGGGG